MKINKMQQGGGMPPFTYYQPVFVNTAQPRYLSQESSSSRSSSNSSSSEMKGEITDKDLLSMLEKVDGLPSDMQAIYQQLASFYDMKDLGIPNTTSLANQYISVLSALKTVKYSKEQFDNAYTNANKKDALNEVAISEDGRIIVQTENGIESKSLDELKEMIDNNESYLPLTNSNLLRIRAEGQPYDSSIISQVNNAISLPYINKLIHDYLGNLGSSERAGNTYEQRRAQTIEKGLAALQQAEDSGEYVSESGLDGLYNVTTLTKTQIDQARAALKYIYEMLPTNAKTLLKYKTDGTNEGAKSLINQFILSETSDTVRKTENMVLDSEGKKLGSKSSTSGSDKGINLNPAMAFLLGEGYSQKISLNVGNSNSINVLGRYGILVDHSGKPIGATQSLADVINGQYAGILDFDNATFGGHKINSLESQNTLLKNADTVGMDLPIDMQALSQGYIKPDLAKTVQLEKADEEIITSGINQNDYVKVNQIYQKYNLPPKYSQTANGWVLNSDIYRRFAAIQATVDGRVLDDVNELSNQDLQTQLVEEVSDNAERKNIEKLIQQRTNNKSYDIDNGWLWGLFGGDHIYKGTIFIPVRENALIAATLAGPSTSNLKFPYSGVMDVDNLLQQQQQNQQINPQQNYVKAPNLSSLQ